MENASDDQHPEPGLLAYVLNRKAEIHVTLTAVGAVLATRLPASSLRLTPAGLAHHFVLKLGHPCLAKNPGFSVP